MVERMSIFFFTHNDVKLFLAVPHSCGCDLSKKGCLGEQEVDASVLAAEELAAAAPKKVTRGSRRSHAAAPNGAFPSPHVTQPGRAARLFRLSFYSFADHQQQLSAYVRVCVRALASRLARWAWSTC